MELIDNINRLLGDDLKQALKPGARLKVAASCFSMYAFEALKAELEQVEELCFIFTSPTFVAEEVTDKIRKERKEFHIPKLNRERSLYGSEFEIHLRNKLTQRAIARECADWLRRKARFMSNRTQAPMQPFACVEGSDARTVYMSLHGFTAVDLGYQPGNAVSNLVNKMDEPPFTATYLHLFDQIWNDTEKVEDVTTAIVDHIATVYQENSPESIYFLMLYNIFNEFLGDVDEDVLPNDRTGYQDTLIWQKLFNFQRDAPTGIINKLETTHAVLQLNAEDGGKRSFIVVQLPELVAEDSEAFKAGYKTIAEVSKERIRRAGKKIKQLNSLLEDGLDIGFRVLKIDTSNMADVFYAPDAVNQSALEGFTDNIKPDRSAEDLLFQVMLDWGVDLALPITRQTIQGREVLFVDTNALAACFDASGQIDEAFVKEMATHKPLRAVFRDAGFKDSAAKINVEQIFKLLSPGTEEKCI